MEDRCVYCGEDISDMSTQVCSNCLNERMKVMNAKRAKYLRKERERRLHRDWLNRRPSKWRIISYLKWLRDKPKLTK